MNEPSTTKKALILETARRIGVQKWTPAEIDQLRRRLIAEHGEAGKTGAEYIADVLEGAGWKLELTLQEEAEDQYEEEFEDLLHFKTLEDAEVSVMRLDELMRKFRSQGETCGGGAGAECGATGKAASGNDFAQSRKWKRRSARRKKRSPTGFASGWRLRTRFLTGWMCASSLRNSEANFRTWGWTNERSGERAGKRRAGPAAIFAGRGILSMGSEVKAVGMELLETESREPVRGSQAAQIWSAAFPVLAARRILRGGFFQPPGPSEGVLRHTRNTVSSGGGAVPGGTKAHAGATAGIVQPV